MTAKEYAFLMFQVANLKDLVLQLINPQSDDSKDLYSLNEDIAYDAFFISKDLLSVFDKSDFRNLLIQLASAWQAIYKSTDTTKDDIDLDQYNIQQALTLTNELIYQLKTGSLYPLTLDESVTYKPLVEKYFYNV